MYLWSRVSDIERLAHRSDGVHSHDGDRFARLRGGPGADPSAGPGAPRLREEYNDVAGFIYAVVGGAYAVLLAFVVIIAVW